MENKKQAIEANFEKYKGKEIFKTVRISGDDCYELIEKFSKKYK